MKMKRRLTEQQEFDILKLVLDKFLWIGFIVMLYGLYKIVNLDYLMGFITVIVGAVLLIVFVILLIREYEVVKRY